MTTDEDSVTILKKCPKCGNRIKEEKDNRGFWSRLIKPSNKTIYYCQSLNKEHRWVATYSSDFNDWMPGY